MFWSIRMESPHLLWFHQQDSQIWDVNTEDNSQNGTWQLKLQVGILFRNVELHAMQFGCTITKKGCFSLYCNTWISGAYPKQPTTSKLQLWSMAKKELHIAQICLLGKHIIDVRYLMTIQIPWKKGNFEILMVWMVQRRCITLCYRLSKKASTHTICRVHC